MFTLKVGRSAQYQDIAENETRLRVPFEIVRPVLDEDGNPTADDDGSPIMEVVAERNESFPISVKLEEVQTVLRRHLEVFTEDWNRFEANKERQAQLDSSQEVANSISGITIE
jgi:hypothetical protein